MSGSFEASGALVNVRDAILTIPLAKGLDEIFVLDLGNSLDGIFVLSVENFLDGIFAIFCFLETAIT